MGSIRSMHVTYFPYACNCIDYYDIIMAVIVNGASHASMVTHPFFNFYYHCPALCAT